VVWDQVDISLGQPTRDSQGWIDMLQSKPPRRAVVFVDNSGADIVLGVLPFVRELLRLGAAVRTVDLFLQIIVS
jgi:hypothetical protein